jgi:dienelactone hydrolase
MAAAGATIEDITYPGPDGAPVAAFLVRPDPTPGVAPSGPGILAWHWLDAEAPDGDRTQFLDEARVWAASGVTSLLPQGRFPWLDDPTDSRSDRAAILAEVGRLRAGLDLLATRPEVDANRLAVVGHDFGGMLATVAATAETRLAALVVVAATPRWGDWFLPFWPIAGDRLDYLRELRDLDPVACIGRAGPAEVLLQYGRCDYYIALMAGRELQRAAPEGTTLLAYDAEHDMRLPEIRADRLGFLRRVLGLGDAAPTDAG